MTKLVTVPARQEFTAYAEKLLACTTPTTRQIDDRVTIEFRRSNKSGNLIQVDYNSLDFIADNVIRAVDLTDAIVILTAQAAAQVDKDVIGDMRTVSETLERSYYDHHSFIYEVQKRVGEGWVLVDIDTDGYRQGGGILKFHRDN